MANNRQMCASSASLLNTLHRYYVEYRGDPIAGIVIQHLLFDTFQPYLAQIMVWSWTGK
jgi:hypothetical protein